jgi:hypothetical protein
MNAPTRLLVGNSVRVASAVLLVAAFATSPAFGADKDPPALVPAGSPAFGANARDTSAVTSAPSISNSPVTDPGAHVTEAATASKLEPAPPAKDVITLPRMVVHGAPDLAKPATSSTLPRMHVRPAGKDTPADPFETPAARDARLVKKHLSAFDRLFLNRFNLFGVSKEQRARQAEDVEQTARQLDDIADLLELNQRDGRNSAEDRKLREAYLDAFVARPK